MALANTVVRVKQGLLRGVVEENVYGGSYLTFNGIPYAKPPVGHLRYKDPEPAEPWAGIRDASQYGGCCAQINALTGEFCGNDDCLYLNVYRPMMDANTKRAVMVWVHGGSFVNGSADNILYGPDYLVRKDIILVATNYRVGVLGFLNLEHELAPGNQGLKDQVAALKWVQENISSFGGDPNNVTIFGESAGGASVHYLTISPLAQGLFHKAIIQGGVSTNPWASIPVNPSKYAYQLAAKLGEKSTDPQTVIDFLRRADPRSLVVTEVTLVPPEYRHVVFGAFGPGVDDKSKNPFLPKPASELMKQGIQVPLIIGCNNNEGALFITPFKEPDVDEKLQILNDNFSTLVPVETMEYIKKEGITMNDVRQFYFGNEPITRESIQLYADYISDAMFLRGIHDVVNIQMEKSTHPTYFYKFSYNDDDSILKSILKIPLPGASHAEDILYLFCVSLVRKSNFDPPKEGSDTYNVIQYFTQMWTNFAKTGNPTPEITETITTKWKPLENSDVYNYLNINTTIQMETCDIKSQRHNWQNIKNKL